MSAFQECEHADGVAAAAALEGQANALDVLDRAAQEGSQALAAGRAALEAGQLEESRSQAKSAREWFSTPGLGEAGVKGLETVESLERALEEAETKAGLVREGLEVSTQKSQPLLCFADSMDMQVLDRAEKAMDAGKWEESGAMISEGQKLLERGQARECDRQKAVELLERARKGGEQASARARGLAALEEGLESPISCTLWQCY